MAEVVEINIISRVVLDNDILFSFIHEQVEIQGNRTIEAMNNWAYEGLHRLGSKEDIQNLLDTKIVCITQKAVDGYVGLNIEKVDKRFYYRNLLDKRFVKNPVKSILLEVVRSG